MSSCWDEVLPAREPVARRADLDLLAARLVELAGGEALPASDRGDGPRRRPVDGAGGAGCGPERGRSWTARLLADEPERVAAAHRSVLRGGRAGRDDGELPGERRGSGRGRVRRGRCPAADHPQREPGPGGGRRVSGDALVAASVGPYGAHLADGSEYTGRYGVPASRLRDFHAPRLELLAAAGPDLLAVETIPDADEAEVLVGLLDDLDVAAWFSYAVRGDRTAAGQPLDAAYAVLDGCRPLVATGVNCSDQDDVLGAVEAAVAATGWPAVAYPNRGGTWDPSTKSWAYGAPVDLDLVPTAGWRPG